MTRFLPTFLPKFLGYLTAGLAAGIFVAACKPEPGSISKQLQGSCLTAGDNALRLAPAPSSQCIAPSWKVSVGTNALQFVDSSGSAWSIIAAAEEDGIRKAALSKTAQKEDQAPISATLSPENWIVFKDGSQSYCLTYHPHLLFYFTETEVSKTDSPKTQSKFCIQIAKAPTFALLIDSSQPGKTNGQPACVNASKQTGISMGSQSRPAELSACSTENRVVFSADSPTVQMSQYQKTWDLTLSKNNLYLLTANESEPTNTKLKYVPASVRLTDEKESLCLSYDSKSITMTPASSANCSTVHKLYQISPTL